MLCEFKVGNFLSFAEEQTFSMEAGKVRNFIERVYTDKKFKLLKFNAIYGANASGKSNFVEAIAFARSVILRRIPKGCGDRYCRVTPDNINTPSHFEFTIKIGDEKYVYGFQLLLNPGVFTSEYLKQFRYGNTYKTVFSRDIEKGTYQVDSYFKDPALNERLRIYAEDVRQDGSVLFLHLMNQNKDSLYSADSPIKLYRQVFHWFKYKLSVNSPNNPITDYLWLTDSDSVEKIGELLSHFDTGVSGLSVVDVSVEKVMNDVPADVIQHITDDLTEQKLRYEKNNMTETPVAMLRAIETNLIYIMQLDGDYVSFKALEFRHKGTLSIFSADEESDGTIRLLDLIEVLLCKDPERIYIIDEINRKFHPLLTYEFVRQYLEQAATRNIQLIVTTHESRLMDFDLLRKDEISFINKEETGRSTIFSLDRFNERFDKKIRAAYLKGDYGAVPRFGD